MYTVYRHCGTAQTATAGQISLQSIGPFRPQKEKNKCNPLPGKCLLADEFPPLSLGVWLGLKKDAMRSDAEEVRHVYPERALGQSGMRKSSYAHNAEISAELLPQNSSDSSTCQSARVLHVRAEGLKTNVTTALD